MPQPAPDHPLPALTVDRETNGTTQTIAVRGEVDIATVQRMRAAIDRALGSAPGRVVVDLRATTFMDTSGVHCLLDARRLAEARGLDLVVIPGPAPVRRLLSLCGFDVSPVRRTRPEGPDRPAVTYVTRLRARRRSPH